MSSATVIDQKSASFASAFAGLMMRDLRVLRREIGPFVVRVVMQPLLFLFVFTYIFPRIGQGSALGGANFATVLLPGLMAVAIMFSGIAAVALPLSQEFGVTREIDDRVMCPLPVAAVAIEKVCFSSIQSVLAALLVIPLAGTSLLAAIAMVYASELYPTPIRSRGAGVAAGATKLGGVLIIALVVAATTTPSIALTATIGVVPLVIGLLIFGWFGRETHNRRLEEISEAEGVLTGS